MMSKKYRYLIALAREKHFGRAAARCNVSPSTLSAAIRDLEIELGVPIVERGRQYAGLTREGQCVLDAAQRMAESIETLRQELGRLHGGLSGELRIGVIPTGLTVIASLTAHFARLHPRVTVQVLSLSTDEILTRLRAFEIDAGVIYIESGDAPDLQVLPVWREDHVLLTHRRGELEHRASITWHEASGLPLCLLTRDMQNRKTIDGVFASLGCAARPTLETNSIVSMLAHVCSGVWSSIVPRSVLDMIGVPAEVRVLELVSPSVAWSTGLVTLMRTPLPPMVRALLDVAPAVGGEARLAAGTLCDAGE